MESFSKLLALSEGNLPATCRFASQRPVTQSFDIFLWFVPEQTAEQTMETPLIWDAIMLIIMPL